MRSFMVAIALCGRPAPFSAAVSGGFADAPSLFRIINIEKNPQNQTLRPKKFRNILNIFRTGASDGRMFPLKEGLSSGTLPNGGDC